MRRRSAALLLFVATAAFALPVRAQDDRVVTVTLVRWPYT
jgi:hypothetical protein